MLNKEQIEQELFNAEYLRKLTNFSRAYTKCYWRAGYIVALKVVLGIEKSGILKEIKDITDFETLAKIIKEQEQ